MLKKGLPIRANRQPVRPIRPPMRPIRYIRPPIRPHLDWLDHLLDGLDKGTEGQRNKGTKRSKKYLWSFVLHPRDVYILVLTVPSIIFFQLQNPFITADT